jgi:hypothetical protein
MLLLESGLSVELDKVSGPVREPGRVYMKIPLNEQLIIEGVSR